MNFIKHPGFLIPLCIVALAGLWVALVKFSGANSGTFLSPTANILNKTNQKSPEHISNQNLKSPTSTPGFSMANQPAQEKPQWRQPKEMSETQSATEIAELEDRIEREDAIQRLNAGKVTAEERTEYGQLFERIVSLKKVDIEIASAKVAAEMQKIAKNHQHNLARAGITPQQFKRSN